VHVGLRIQERRQFYPVVRVVRMFVLLRRKLQQLSLTAEVLEGVKTVRRG
jgi:hypothetical protein